MKTLTKQNALDIINWFNKYGAENWGTWGNYPTLPVGASYLQYDTNPCQINLDEAILINGESVNCISNSRFTVGKKWKKNISFESLKDWAIDGYKENKIAARKSEIEAIIEIFDSLPKEIKDLYYSCNNLSNNKRKAALNAILRPYGLHAAKIDDALIAAGRRAETPYNI